MTPIKQKPVLQLVDWASFDTKIAASSLDGKSKKLDRAELSKSIKERVRGQDEAIDLMVKEICNGYAKETRDAPVATIILVGPPGVGKTEVAKVISEIIFGSANDMLRIDCADYKSPGSSAALIGESAFYQGTESGGALTRPMFAKQERVVLFDEIEKMDKTCYDVFLSMLGEGRVTEKTTKKVADFTRSIVIITSNLEHDKCRNIAETITDYEARIIAYKAIFEPLGFRPEILNRFRDFIYFRQLPPRVMAEIIAQKISKLCGQYGLVCESIAVDAVFHLLEQVTRNNDGVRGMIAAMERRIGDSMVDVKNSGAKRVSVGVVDGQLLASPV